MLRHKVCFVLRHENVYDADIDVIFHPCRVQLL